MQSLTVMQSLQRKVACSDISAASKLKPIPTDHKDFRKLPENVQALSDAFDDAYDRRDDYEAQRLKDLLAKSGFVPIA